MSSGPGVEVMLERSAFAAAPSSGKRTRSLGALPHHRGMRQRANSVSNSGRVRNPCRGTRRARRRRLARACERAERRPCRESRAVLRVGRQVPFDARAASVGRLPARLTSHAAESSRSVHPGGDAGERPRPALDRQGHAPPAHARRATARIAACRIRSEARTASCSSPDSAWEELESGTSQAAAQRAPGVEAQALELLPAPRVAPGAVAPPLEGRPA